VIIIDNPDSALIKKVPQMLEFFVARESPLWYQVQVHHFDSAPNFNSKKYNERLLQFTTREKTYLNKQIRKRLKYVQQRNTHLNTLLSVVTAKQ